MNKKMEKIKGIVEAVSSKEVETKKGPMAKYGLKIDGEWYNSWGSCPTEKDASVEIEFEVNDYGNQVKTVRKLDGEPEPKPEAPPVAPKTFEGDYRMERVAKMQACYEDALEAISGALGYESPEKVNVEAVYKTALSMWIQEMRK